MAKVPPHKSKQAEKATMHPRSKHRARYDFEALIAAHPPLEPLVRENPHGDLSVDFANPKSVLALNTALLKHFYGLTYFELPEHYLCPPVPGRAEYVHHMADLLAEANDNTVPQGSHIRCLDIGTGANCVYPIIGIQEYGWHFTGSEIDPVALSNGSRLIKQNAVLQGKLELRRQNNPRSMLGGILKKDEEFDLSFCNPPFYGSAREANAASARKIRNLKPSPKGNGGPSRNFAGQSNELWCPGGELGFIQRYVRQSEQYPSTVRWYSTLVSQQANLKGVYSALRNAKALEVRTIPMALGNKVSRIVVWTFMQTSGVTITRRNRDRDRSED